MSFFDYRAPAELFLAKPMKGSRTKYWRFAQRLRLSVMQSKTYGRPKSSARGWRKPMIFRCANLSDRRHAAHAQAL